MEEEHHFPGHIVIWGWWAEDPALTLVEAALLSLLWDQHASRWGAYPVKLLADPLRLSEQSVRRVVKKLVGAGYLQSKAGELLVVPPMRWEP